MLVDSARVTGQLTIAIREDCLLNLPFPGKDDLQALGESPVIGSLAHTPSNQDLAVFRAS